MISRDYCCRVPWFSNWKLGEDCVRQIESGTVWCVQRVRRQQYAYQKPVCSHVVCSSLTLEDHDHAWFEIARATCEVISVSRIFYTITRYPDTHLHIFSQQPDFELRAQKDMRNLRRCGPSSVLTIVSIVNGNTVDPMPYTRLLPVIYIALARGLLIPH